MAGIPGVRCYLTNPPPIPTGGSRFSRSLYQVTIQGTDVDELFRYGAKLESQVRALPQCQDVSSDLQLKSPEVNMEMDRDRAFVLGVTPLQIEQALYSAYGTRQISTILAPHNEYQVIMELQPEFHATPALLSLLYIRSTQGALVPLAAVVKPSEDIGPLAINHTGQLPSVTISFNLKPGVALGEALQAISELTRQTMPGGIILSLQGSATTNRLRDLFGGQPPK